MKKRKIWKVEKKNLKKKTKKKRKSLKKKGKTLWITVIIHSVLCECFVCVETMNPSHD